MGRTTNNHIKYILGLDGLRAISVLLVIYFHYAGYFPGAFSSSFFLVPAIGKLLSIGWVGVDIFFVISGFLITTILIRNPANSAKKYLTFIQRRAKRLLPAYLCCVIVVLLAATYIYPDDKIVRNQYLLWTMSSNISTLFGDRSALGGEHFSMVHFWSLALEWQFYITFPLALTLIKSPRTAAMIAIALAVISRTFLIYLSPLNYDNAIYSFTFCRGDALAAGVFLATLSPSKNLLKTYAVGAIGLCLFSVMLFSLALSSTPFKSIFWLQTTGYTAIATSIAMILYFILNINRDSLALRFLELPPITAVGRASYSLYIWHLPFYPVVVELSKNTFSTPQGQLIFSAGIATLITCTLGVLSYKFIESSFMLHRRQINPVMT